MKNFGALVVLSILIFTQVSCKNKNLSGDFGSSSSPDTPAPAPVTLTLPNSVSSPSVVQTPTIIVSGDLTVGDIVQIYTNALCTQSSLSGQATVGASSVSVTVFNALPDGTYTFFANVTGADNKTSGCSATSVSYTVDTTPPSSPTIAVSGAYVNGSNSYIGSTSVTLALSAKGGPAQMKISTGNSCSGGTWEAYATTRSWTLASGDGTKTLSAEYKDAAGNVSSCAIGLVILDTTAPSAPSSLSLDSGTSTSTSTPNLSFTTSTDSSSGIARYEARVIKASDSSVVKDWTNVGTASPVSITSGLSLASSTNYQMVIRAVDNVGNVSATATSSTTWTSTAPPAPASYIPAGFIWQGGSNLVRQAGVYGTLGVGSTNNIPGNRDSFATATDSSGNLWLFGGETHPAASSWKLMNDLWKYTPSDGKWTWMSGSNTADPLPVFGTKGVPSTSNVPGPRAYGAMWVDHSGYVWVFGGESTDANGSAWSEMDDLWRFNPSTSEWTWIAGSDQAYDVGTPGTLGVANANNSPGSRDGTMYWTDSSGNLWLFGGFTYFSGSSDDTNDLWKFDTTSLKWTWMGGTIAGQRSGVYGVKGVGSTNNIPGSREYGLTAVDNNGIVWIFGGYSYDSAGAYGRMNDLWKFDPATLQWTWVSGPSTRNQAGTWGTINVANSTNIPSARAPAAVWTNATGDFYVFGGYGNDSLGNGNTLNDVWKYSSLTDQWTWIAGSNLANQTANYGTLGVADPNNIPGGRSGDWWNTGYWYDGNGRMWLFGGGGYDSTGTSDDLNDFWFYTQAAASATPVLVGAASVQAGTSTNYTAYGGTSPYTYSVVSGGGSINASGTFTAPASVSSVIIQVTDSASQSAQFGVSIWVPPTAPTGLALQNPTASPGVVGTPTIEVSGVISGYAVYLYTNSTCTSSVVGSATANASNLADITVSSTLAIGTYNFYARQMDTQSHASSCSTATVSYQYAPPQITIATVYTDGSGNRYSNTSTPNLTLYMPGSPVQMKISNNNSCTGGSWETYATSKTAWALVAGDGTKQISFVTKDGSGTQSACITDTAIVDTTVPTAPSGISLGANFSSTGDTPSISFTNGTDGGSGIGHYDIRILKNSDSSVVLNWTNAGTASPVSLTSGVTLVDGTVYLVEVRAVDNVGNVSAVDNSVTDAGASGTWTAIIPPTPTGLSLLTPSWSPGAVLPGINVTGVVSGVTVNLFTNSTCTTKVGYATASGTSAVVTAGLYTYSTNNFYANTQIGSQTSACSTATVQYIYDPDISIVDLPEVFQRHDEGSGTHSFRIRITPAKPYDVVVTYDLFGSTAVNGTHYTGLSAGTVTIPANQALLDLNFDLPENAIADGEKYLQINLLKSSTGAVQFGSQYSAREYIVDNDSVYETALHVNAADATTCGITSSGKLKCWGYNGYGQLGDGTTIDRASPVIIDAGTSYASVSVGANGHTCGVTSAGVLKCWGFNGYGQLGDGTTTLRSSPVVVDSGTSYSAVSAGNFSTCGITSSGVLKCWGYNSLGQLGNGGTANQNLPVVIDAGTAYAHVSAGKGFSTCGITTTNVLKCWGRNGNGELGDGTTTDSHFPEVIDAGTSYSAVSTGDLYACAITAAGALKCWGENGQSQLGDGTTTSQTLPELVDSGTTYTSIVASIYNTCGITSTGVLRCWGYNSHFALGIRLTDSTPKTYSTPITVDPGASYLEVALAENACGILSNGITKCWGDNVYGELGIGVAGDVLSPQIINPAVALQQIKASGDSTCGLTNLGEYWCTGMNYDYQIGDGTQLNRHTFVRGGVNILWSKVTTTDLISCGTMAAANYSRCWSYYITPMDLLTQYSVVDPGYYQVCEVSITGILKCGSNYNGFGEEGNGTNTTQNNPPAVIDTGINYATVASGTYHTCGITSAGVLKCWGTNDDGELGNGTTTTTAADYSPTVVDSGVQYSAVALGRGLTCGITTSNVLKCWGANNNGQVGDGTAVVQPSPKVIDSGTTYSVIAVHDYHVCGITTAGVLKCWGDNYYGEVGDGTKTPRLSPVVIDAGTTYTSLTLGSKHACATTTGGVTKCWGDNSFGQMGDGQTGVFTWNRPIGFEGP